MKELNIRELQDRLDAISEKRKPKIKKPDNLTTAIEEIPSGGFNYDNMEDIGFLYDNIQDGLYGDDFADYADIIHSDLYAILDLYKKAAEQQADREVPSSPSSPGVPIPAEIGQQIEALKANMKASISNIDSAMFNFEDSIESKTEDQVIDESPAGDALQSAYDKVYNFVGEYDDAALEYLNDNAPIFSEMFDKYDGEFDVMASNLDADTLQQVMDELNDVAFDLESGVLESKTEEQELEEFKSLIGRTGGVMGFKN